jgi:hypothetical protein
MTIAAIGLLLVGLLLRFLPGATGSPEDDTEDGG